MDLEAAQRIIGEDTLSLWVMPVFLISVIAEAVWAWRRQRDVYETSDTVNSMTMLVHEYAAILRDLAHAPSWTDCWSYLMQPPGWSHDGRDKRVKALRAEAGL